MHQKEVMFQCCYLDCFADQHLFLEKKMLFRFSKQNSDQIYQLISNVETWQMTPKTKLHMMTVSSQKQLSELFRFAATFSIVWCPANCPTANVTELPKRGYISRLTLFLGARKLHQDVTCFCCIEVDELVKTLEMY